MRMGCSYSPRTLASNFIWLSMPGRGHHATYSGM
jgi:hypothetical protein